MMYKWMRILIMLLLLALPVSTKAELPLLVITDSSDEDAGYALAESLVFMGLDYHMTNQIDDVDISGYSRVILFVSRHTDIQDEQISLLIDSALPLFIIGPGGIGELLDVRAVEGSFSVAYTFLSGVEKSLLTQRMALNFPSQWDKDLGGSIGLIEGERLPLCVQRGNITFLAWFDAGSDVMRSALPDLLARWMWPYNDRPTRFGLYLVLEEVYPFEDPELLLMFGNSLSTRGIPYAIEVMPVQKNAEYPSMKRFCEVLTYLQSNGAFIALSVPLHGLQALDLDELKEAIRIAFEAYVQYGVYPLALSAPIEYLWNEKGLDTLRGVKTILLRPGSQVAVVDRNSSFADGHLLIAPSEAQSELLTDVYATALYTDIHQEPEVFLKSIKDMNGFLFKSLWDINNAMYIGENGLFNTGSMVTYNNNEKSLAYHPFVYERHNYDRGLTQYLTVQIQKSNQILTLLVIIAVTAFLLIIYAARRQMKRQFLHTTNNKGNIDG